MQTTNPTVAQIILQQLGGNRFIAMTGAKRFVASDNALTFSLPGAGGFCKDSINCVRVTLMPTDTYKMEFMRIRGVKVTTVCEVEDVYCDDLCRIFTMKTGLHTSL